MDKQTLLFKDIVKIMGIIPTVNKKDIKSIECALSRENKKLETKFDKMFKILFYDNDNLERIIPIHMISSLENDIKNILYYNPIDQLSIEIIKEKYFFFPYFFILLKKVYNMNNELIKYYSSEKKINIDIKDKENCKCFFRNNISLLLKWLRKTPIFNTLSLNEYDFIDADIKNLSDWKNGKNIMTTNTVLKIRKNLENFTKSNKDTNKKDYIDFFIFSLYLESCKRRLNNEFINRYKFNFFNFALELTEIFSPLQSEIEKISKKLECDLSFLKNELKKEAVDVKYINNLKNSYDNNSIEKIYGKLFSPHEIKNKEYRLKEDEKYKEEFKIVDSIINSGENSLELLQKIFLSSEFIKEDFQNLYLPLLETFIKIIEKNFVSSKEIKRV